MSKNNKYLYKTVYEEFTGKKPPSANDIQKKTKSRRMGCGHPYRKRSHTKKKHKNADTIQKLNLLDTNLAPSNNHYKSGEDGCDRILHENVTLMDSYDATVLKAKKPPKLQVAYKHKRRLPEGTDKNDDQFLDVNYNH